MCDGTRTRSRYEKHQEVLQHVTKHRRNETKDGNTQWVYTYEEGRRNDQCGKKNENKTDVKMRRESNLGERRGPCTDNRSHTQNQYC